MQERKFYIGIDWATERHALCVIDASGVIIKERSVANDLTLFDVIAELTGGAEPREVFIAIETRRLVLVEALVARGFKVYTINPLQSDRFRDRFSVAGAKDDRLDARVLAASLRTDIELFRAVEAETAEQVRLRNATRLRQTIQDQAREVANRLRDVVMTTMPLLLALCPGADEAWFWDLIGVVGCPEEAKRASDETVRQLLRKHRIRRLSVEDIRAVLERSHLPAAPGVRESARWQIGVLVEQLALLAKQQKVIDCEVKAALQAIAVQDGQFSDVEIIMSAPGFADQTTSIFLAEAAGAIKRRDYAELRILCGAAPVTRSSGKRRRPSKWDKTPKADGVVLMRRAINLRLRNAAHHAGSAAIRDPRFQPIYARLRAQGRTHARAVRGVVDRLLKVLVAMLRNRTLYGVGPTTA